MIERIEFLEDIFEDFNFFVDELEYLDEEADAELIDYWITYELPFYLDELNWGLEAIIEGVNSGYATTEEIWQILNPEDVESIFDLLDELDCTEEEMKGYFAENGDDPSEVDFFFSEGYNLDDELTGLIQLSKSSKRSASRSTSRVAGNIYVL